MRVLLRTPLLLAASVVLAGLLLSGTASGAPRRGCADCGTVVDIRQVERTGQWVTHERPIGRVEGPRAEVPRTWLRRGWVVTVRMDSGEQREVSMAHKPSLVVGDAVRLRGSGVYLR